MGRALETITVFATAPNTGAAGAAATGNSLTIRNTDKPAWLLAISGLQQATAGFNRLTSPQLHDTTTGIQVQFAASQASEFSLWTPQRLYSQDTLTDTISGSNTAGDIETRQLLVAYDDLPGVDANLIDVATLRKRIDSLYSVPISLTAVATGQYGTAAAVNASADQFKANREYAVLGIAGTATGVAGVRISGPDLGNLGIVTPSLPLETDASEGWWPKTAMRAQWPTIPVFNSANKALTFLQSVGNENAATFTGTLLMALLSDTGRKK